MLRQVGALGIPASPTMYYRGTLDAPAGMHTVRAALFDAATGGAMQCQSDVVSVSAGPLEVPLPDVCTTAVHNSTSLFVELTVDGTAIPTRSRLGAVPFAVEADRAVRATAADGALATQLATLTAQVAALTATDRDCPNGYTRDTTDATITATMRLCVRTVASGRDEVVRVGSGASAFWVDRHEATVYNAVGTRFGESSADYAAVGGGLLPNGRWLSSTVTTPPLQAVSRPGVIPSRFITWFQANEVCRAAGKRLLTREEWFAAIQGTDDPAAGNDGTANARCNTLSGGPRVTGRGATGCVSAWGAQDMIGNLWEWTGEWYASVGAITSPTVSLFTRRVGDTDSSVAALAA